MGSGARGSGGGERMGEGREASGDFPSVTSQRDSFGLGISFGENEKNEKNEKK